MTQLDLFAVETAVDNTARFVIDYKGDQISIEHDGSHYRYNIGFGFSDRYFVFEWVMYNAQRLLDIKTGRLILRNL